MAYLYSVPYWFIGFSITMEIVFALIAMSVAYFSLKIYALSGQREPKLFGMAFGAISISYLIWGALNFFVLRELNEEFKILTLEKLTLIGSFGIYAHMLLFTVGLITLSFMTFRIKGRRIYTLLVTLSFLVILFSQDKFYAFQILSSILLLLISFHYISEYNENKNPITLLILIAFIFLLISSTALVFTNQSHVYYIVGHIFELVAYVIILVGLVLTIKK